MFTPLPPFLYMSIIPNDLARHFCRYVSSDCWVELRLTMRLRHSCFAAGLLLGVYPQGDGKSAGRTKPGGAVVPPCESKPRPLEEGGYRNLCVENGASAPLGT